MIKSNLKYKTKPAKPTVVITGGSGLLGSAIIKKLAGRYHVFAADIAHPSFQLPKSVEFHKIDLTSDESTQEVINCLREKKIHTIASVIHLAAYYDFSGRPSDMYQKLTVRGTQRLIRSLKGLDVEQFIFTSTILVHAPCAPGEKIDENWSFNPKWDYPKSKVEAETVIRKEAIDMPTVILRIAGVYDDMCHSIPISNQIQRIYENRLTAHVFPDGKEYGQPFLHKDDLIDAIVKIVDQRKNLPKNSVLLIGEPDTYSYEEIQKKLGRLIHGDRDWSTRSIPKMVAKAGAWIQEKAPVVEDPFIKPWMVDIANDHYTLDISQAKKLLGWQPQHRLIDTLPQMVNRLKRDPYLWYEENKLALPSDLKKKETSYKR